AGETWHFTDATHTAPAGQHHNTPGATGTPPVGGNVSASDVANYFGSSPAIRIVNSGTGDDANRAPGVFVASGGGLTFTYDVTNSGNVPLANLTINDDNAACTAFSPSAVVVPGFNTRYPYQNLFLAAGETWHFTDAT